MEEPAMSTSEGPTDGHHTPNGGARSRGTLQDERPVTDRSVERTRAPAVDPMAPSAGAPLRDRIRWGPLWAGLMVAISTYLLLQLALVATGVVDLGQADVGAAVATAAAAFVAFILGGITAGATAMWRGADDGLLHGIVMWALGLVVLIGFSAIGSGLALGSIDATETFDTVFTEEGTLTAEEIDVAGAADDAQEAASWALLGLTAALIAAAIGGVAGAKMWPRTEVVDVTDAPGRTGPRHSDDVHIES
jgi:hypothetical protein